MAALGGQERDRQRRHRPEWRHGFTGRRCGELRLRPTDRFAVPLPLRDHSGWVSVILVLLISHFAQKSEMKSGPLWHQVSLDRAGGSAEQSAAWWLEWLAGADRERGGRDHPGK